MQKGENGGRETKVDVRYSRLISMQQLRPIRYAVVWVALAQCKFVTTLGKHLLDLAPTQNSPQRARPLKDTRPEGAAAVPAVDHGTPSG